ncbi:transposase [Nocardia sp. CA-128927]|uniref:transposase n=1 Tax=Nocardia sp. CA-128927 TaxID=3239975 RepID=UPI003D96FE74
MLVAKGYRWVDRDQQFLMPPDMREWLSDSDPVWLVIEAVAGLDTSRLHAKRRTGGVGRAGYDPDMLLTLLIWAWAQGQRSSRKIEWLCSRDVTFRVICAGDVPDHVTIARFRGELADVVEELFTQVLVLCARLGMGRLGVVAMDSVKIASNASLSANRTEEGLRAAAGEQAVADAARAAARAAAAEHAATDAAEDEQFGPDERGGGMSTELVEPSARAARIAAALAELEAENAARAEAREGAGARRREREQARQVARDAMVADYQRRRDERGPRVGLPPAEIRVQVLTRNWEQARAAQQAKIERWLAAGGRGRRPAPVDEEYAVKRVRRALDRAVAAQAVTAQAEAVTRAGAARKAAERAGNDKDAQRNITDPESRPMPLRGGGWLQGFNCQAVTCGDGLIIATGVANNPSDCPAFAEMMGKAATAADLITAHHPVDTHENPSIATLLNDYTAAVTAPAGPDTTGETSPAPIGMLLADAGYLSTDNLTAAGPARLIAIGKRRDLATAARTRPTTGPPPTDAPVIEQMDHRLRTPEGAALYKQRSHIAETPFGHAKHNLGFRRFTSRGTSRAAAEFSFHALVHNLFKAIGTRHLTLAPC